MDTPDHGWKPAPASVLPVVLKAGEVHIWRATLDLSSQQAAQYAQTLSLDEQRRAERFHFERDRTRFIVGRGILRLLLSQYTGIAPASLQIRYNAYGRPELAHTCGGPPLDFNVSHSQGLALYAFVRGCGVGIDVELVREDIQYEEIAQHFFSPVENAALATVPPERRCHAFFSCWTRKEAFIKAHGKGLSLPLTQFDVSLVPDQPAQLLQTRYDGDDASRWALYELDVADEYAAALAVGTCHRSWQFHCWHYSIPQL